MTEKLEGDEMTERAPYRFQIHEFSPGQPCICMEPQTAINDLSILRKGILGFDLPQGITLEKAQLIADYLNENLINVIYTPI